MTTPSHSTRCTRGRDGGPWPFRALVVCAAVGMGESAHAGGLYFSDRGVRPIGRGGAFVAGADDLGAVAYNPAGIADAKNSVLVDASFLDYRAEHQRELRIVDADGVVRYVTSPRVSGRAPFLPLPTLALSHTFGPKEEFTLAGTVFAPYIAIATYPQTVEGKPSPSRYAFGSFDSSALAFTGLTFAYKPSETLRLGVGLGAAVGMFQSTVTYSMSPPDRILSAPENPDYDAASRFRVGPIVAPTGSLGVIYSPASWVRLGGAVQLPTVVSSRAEFDVRLPRSATFDRASIAGRTAHMKFVLPAVARLGVEFRPNDATRLEVAYVREFWSMHETMDLTPEDVAIENMVGLPARVPLPAIRVPRHFQDSNSYRFGAEHTIRVGDHDLTLRAGLAYDTSAIPPAYVSLLTIDSDKIMTSVGASMTFGKHWRIDATYAHFFVREVYVRADEARITRINPLPGNATPEAVNGGRYAARADLFGLGVQYRF